MSIFDNTETAFKGKEDADLKRAHFLFSSIKNPQLVKMGASMVNFAFTFGLPIKGLVKKTIFKQFVGGETIEGCSATIAELGKYNIGTILDYSAEGLATEAGFEAALAEILRTVERSGTDKNVPFSVFKVTALGAFELLDKVSAGIKLSTEEEAEWERVKQRVDTICKRAAEVKKPTLIDAEESWIQIAIDQLAFEMICKYNQKEAIVYNTVQMYRHDRLAYLKELHHQCEKEDVFLGVKIVRGAYMEKERARATYQGYQDPIQPNKEATDRDYNAALDFIIANINRISLCAGTHNEESSLYLAELLDKNGINHTDKRVYFAQLLGMSDHISYNLSAMQYNVAKYVPYGPVKEVLPYLIRRAQENTSVAGQTGRELSLLKKELARRKISA